MAKNRKNTRADRRAPEQVTPRSVAGEVPPQDLDAEGATLAPILLDEPGALDKVRRILRPECFFSDANRLIYTACINAHDRGIPIDIITIANELRANDLIGAVGGPSYLVQLTTMTPSTHNVAAHAAIVAECKKRRDMIALCQRIAAEGYQKNDTAAFFDDARESLRPILAPHAGKSRVRSFSDVAEDAYEILHRRSHDEEKPIETPWRDLNSLMGGWWPGVYSIISPPGMGKTQFALQAAIHAAGREMISAHAEGRVPRRVRYVALEMKDTDMFVRAMQFVTGRIWSDMLFGRVKDRAMTSILADDNVKKLASLPIDIEQASPLDYSYRDIEALKNEDLLLLVIDYMQLINAPEDTQEDARKTMGRTALAAQELARTTNLPIIGISSTAREHYGANGKKKKDPNDEQWGTGDAGRFLAMAKESGDVEFSSDVVMVLGRNYGDESGVSYLAIAKGRGFDITDKKGWIKLHWNGGQYFGAESEDSPPESGTQPIDDQDFDRVQGTIGTRATPRRARVKQ